MAMKSTRLVGFLRVLGALGLTMVVLALGTFHAIGYREAYARVEDYITSFGEGVPSGIEPYGANQLLKTMQVRYNDAVYQVSFSATSASTEEVIDAYSAALQGPKLIESTGAQSRTLFHFDGRAVTAVRAMPMGMDQRGSFVQKVHALKRPASPELDPRELLRLPELAELFAEVDRRDMTVAERQIRTARTIHASLQRIRERQAEVAEQERDRRSDLTGFDLEAVPRYPASVRRASMALEDGRLQMARYTTPADPGAVAQFYLARLPDEGWSINPVSEAVREEGGAGREVHLIFSREGRELNLLVSASEKLEQTSILAMVQ